jgi:hypothetical protein
MRALALLLVPALAHAGSLAPEPGIRVVKHAAGSAASAPITLRNPSAASVRVQSLDYACGDVRLEPPSGGAPFTIAGGGTQTLTLACPATLAGGMHRCTVTARDSDGAPLAAFTGACETDATAALSADKSALAFGPIANGQLSAFQLVRLSSTKEVATLQLQASDDSFAIGLPCNPNAPGCDANGVGPLAGAPAVVAVACRPARTGAHTAKLFAIGDSGAFLPAPIDLTCTGVDAAGPAIAVTPAVLDAGDIEVNGGTTTGAVHIANAGGAQLTVTALQIADVSVVASADWTFTQDLPVQLDPGAALDLTLAFDPARIGRRDATLIIGYDDGAPRTTSIALAGLGVAPVLELVGASQIDFGVVPLDATATQTIALANTGNRDLADATAGLTPGGAPFQLPANPLAIALAPPLVQVPVRCRSATAIGPIGASVLVMAPDAVGNVTVNVTCEVRDTPLVANPTALQLGELRIGSGVQHALFAVTSAIGPIDATVALPIDPNLTIVAPVGSATTPFTIDVAIDPQVAGSLATALRVIPTSAETVAVPLSANVVTAAVTVPDAVSLGTFCVGQPTTSSQISLVSTGTATIELDAPRMMQATSPFDVVFGAPSRYPALVTANGVAALQVAPKRRLVAGDVADTLVWTTDITGARSLETMVTASFLDSGGAIAPAALDFGRVPIHLAVANPQLVTLQNCSADRLDLLPPEITAPFAIEGTAPMVLMPGESTTLGVTFRPTEVGVATGQLVVTAQQLPGQQLTVALLGEGFSDVPGDDDGNGNGDGRASFYGCSGCASHDASGAPLVLVLLLVIRRRRC